MLIQLKSLPKALAIVCLFCLSLRALALPAAMELDRLLLGVETAVEQQQWDKANTRLIAMNALGSELPAVFYFYRGNVSAQLQQFDEARHALEIYVQKEGREADFYRQSLALLNQIEEAVAERQQSQDQQQAQATEAKNSFQLSMEDVDHKNYIKRIQQLYLRAQGGQALQLHINTLLSNHRYIPGKYRKDSEWLGSLYQIKVKKGGISLITKQAKNADGYSIKQQYLAIYGVNPYLSSNCDSHNQQCWLQHPESGLPWLELEFDRKATTQVADAFSHLFRFMQNN